MRSLVYLLSAAIIAWAASTVPMPLVETAPGGATPIAPLLEVDTETTPINGDFRLLTVSIRQPTLVEATRAWLDDTRELDRRRTFIPEGVDRDEYFELQNAVFLQSAEIAAIVGLRLADVEVTLTSAPLVSGILPDGPSAGLLELGDLVRSINGETVVTSEELAQRTGQSEAGEALALTVERDGELVDVTVVARQARDMDRPGLGVLVQTTIADVDLPFEVALVDGVRIGGPSAGMMITLTIYDLVSPEDVANGRLIAGTGEVSLDGRIGAIGGIAEKVVAAHRAGAELMLVPASQVEEARAVAPDDLRIIGVETIVDALEALRS